MWGDEQVLCLCSMMWQIGLTVVSAETFTQIRFRHRSSLEKADGGSAASCIPMRWDGYILRWDGCIMRRDGCILRSDGCRLK